MERLSLIHILTVHNNGGTEITSVTDQNLNAAALQADGSYLLTVTEDGSYTITATNKAGKSAYTTIVVSGIDRTPPVVEQPTVSYNENMTSAQIVLKANDGNGSGIAKAVSYTHLDVYKRQPIFRPGSSLPARTSAASTRTAR